MDLNPVRDDPQDWDKIERRIAEFFKEHIYYPLLKILEAPKSKLTNTREDLLYALQRGRLVYERGAFQGRFSASISKEIKSLGAKWDKSRGVWRISSSKLPGDVMGAVQIGNTRSAALVKKLDRAISAVDAEAIVLHHLQLDDLIDATLKKFDTRVKESLYPAVSAKRLTVSTELTPATRAKIAEQYTNNLKLYITDFTKKETVTLRKRVIESTMEGMRYEGLIKEIKDSYGVSARKAKFLARQETNLLLAAFKKTRYTDSGVRYYKWRSVAGTPKHPVRPMHKKLNDRSSKGELFDFNHPPIDDPDGSRHNPQENYNCRCIAIPVVKF